MLCSGRLAAMTTSVPTKLPPNPARPPVDTSVRSLFAAAPGEDAAILARADATLAAAAKMIQRLENGGKSEDAAVIRALGKLLGAAVRRWDALAVPLQMNAIPPTISRGVSL